MSVKVILSRKNEFLNRLRPYKVLIDGVQAGKITNGKVEEFEVSVVNQTVECKVDWCYSNKYTIDAQDGDTVYLRVKSGMKGFWFIYPLFIIYLILSFAMPNLRERLGENITWIRLVTVGIPMLYFIYYLTIGRRNYLSLEKDSTNVFAS